MADNRQCYIRGVSVNRSAWLIILVYILLLTPATASFNISNPQMYFHTSGGATINFTDNTSLDAVQWGGEYLNVTVNGSKVGFSGTAVNAMLSKLVYTTGVNDMLSYNASATSGILYTDTNMSQGNTVYVMYVNSSQFLVRTVDATGKSRYFYSAWGGEKNFSIRQGTWTPVPNTVYFIDYTYDCASSGTNVDILSNKVPMFLIVILLIFIIKFPSNSGTNLVGSIVVISIVIIFVGGFMPSILDATNSCGEKNRESFDVGGKQESNITLNHDNIVSASERVYNNTYTAVRNVDYTMNYPAGTIMPLSTGNMYFGS